MKLSAHFISQPLEHAKQSILFGPRCDHHTGSPARDCGNWLAPDHNKWLVPFGAGFGKIARVGTQPVVWQINTYYNALHPRDLPYPKWQVRLQVALLFPAAK